MERNEPDDIIEPDEFSEINTDAEMEKRFNQLQKAVDNYQFELLKKALFRLKIIMKSTLEYLEMHNNRELVNEILVDIIQIFEDPNDYLNYLKSQFTTYKKYNPP